MNKPSLLSEKLTNFTIANSRVVTPEGIVDPGYVRIESGIITEIGQKTRQGIGEDEHDVCGCLLLPGFIDVHADSLEGAIAPRPSTPFAPSTILPSYEVELATHGITTVFHCVGLADLGDLAKPLRTREKASEIISAVNAYRRESLLHTHIHLRYEIADTESIPLLEEMILRRYVDLVSIMDHTPGYGVFKDIEAYRNYYRRSGHKASEADERYEILLNLRSRVDDKELQRLVSSCLENRLSVFSHDDNSIRRLAWALELGINVAEFPVTVEAVDFARYHGMQTVFGTPNLVRGMSHAGNLKVLDMLHSEKVDILCLDYSPRCSLQALFKATELTGIPLHQLSRLFSLNAAISVGIEKSTGSIEVGKVADIIAVHQVNGVPRVLTTYVAGRPVYQSLMNL